MRFISKCRGITLTGEVGLVHQTRQLDAFDDGHRGGTVVSQVSGHPDRFRIGGIAPYREPRPRAPHSASFFRRDMFSFKSTVLG